MKIVCIDKNLDTRTELKNLVQSAFDVAADYLTQPQVNIYSIPTEELLVNSTPDILCFYAKDKVDSALLLCKELSTIYPDIPKAVFLSEELYELKNLNKFENYSCEIFSVTDKPVSIIYKLNILKRKFSATTTGALIQVIGAKGGVGTTSISAALAHAFSAYGKCAVLIDLSPTNALLHYLATEKFSSLEYTTLLKENTLPDQMALDNLLVTAKNGLTCLLPPIGSTDTRELWLRDTQRFEITLALIEILKKRFDIVIVDSSNSEGILNFAIQSRANINLFVTSTDPASIYNLNQRISNLFESSSESALKIIVNNINKSDFNKEDVLDFLWQNPNYSDVIFELPEIPFDKNGAKWIGSGNTFYTECSSKTQNALDLIAHSLLVQCKLVPDDLKADEIKSTVQKRKLSLIRNSTKPKLLEQPTFHLTELSENKKKNDEEVINVDFQNKGDNSDNNETLFEMPKMSKIRGNTGLEILLFISGAAIFAAVTLPQFWQNIFTDTQTSYSENITYSE